MVTPLIFLDPKFTLRTLLELEIFCKLNKILVVTIVCRWYLILLASLPCVELNSAIQAIAFLAEGASEFLEVLVIVKNVLAISSGTPWIFIQVIFEAFLKSELVILVHLIVVEYEFEVILDVFVFATFSWTTDGKLTPFHPSLYIVQDAIIVKDVGTWQGKIVNINVFQADWTLNLFLWNLFCDFLKIFCFKDRFL